MWVILNSPCIHHWQTLLCYRSRNMLFALVSVQLFNDQNDNIQH
jgi:hypothetical protein